MTDQILLMKCIKAAYDKCNDTQCSECEYHWLGVEVCERAFLADYIIQNGFIKMNDDGTLSR